MIFLDNPVLINDSDVGFFRLREVIDVKRDTCVATEGISLFICVLDGISSSDCGGRAVKIEDVFLSKSTLTGRKDPQYGIDVASSDSGGY
jgi:hypothetical protein